MKKINVFIIVSVAFLYACGGADKKEQLVALKAQRDDLTTQIAAIEKELAKEGTVQAVQKSAIVIAKEITPRSFVHYLEIQGKVDSDKNIGVSPKTGGVVQEIYVERGQLVSKGKVLAQLDASPIIAGIGELKKSLELATDLYEKQKSLWEQKVGTEVQYLQAKNQKESLEKKLVSMQEQYDMTRVKAPFEGMVDEIFLRIGEATSPGMPAFRMVNTNSLKAVAEVPESYISSVSKGNAVVLYFPDLKKEVNTKIEIAANVIDPVNRTFKIEMPLAQQGQSFKANMIAYVNIKDYQKENALVVPVNVVQRTDKGDFVYIVENNKAVMVPVKLGPTYKSEVEVLEGLKPGSRVVVVGYQEIVHGQPVVVKDRL